MDQVYKPRSVVFADVDIAESGDKRLMLIDSLATASQVCQQLDNP